MFSDAQEADLGDAIAEQIAPDITLIDEDELSDHLRRLGDRLTRFLPPNHFRFEIFLIDFPIADAFSLPGGRVYVSRKLVVSAHNDDEIAGVLAHEFGHIVTHQIAIHMTTYFRRALGANQVGNRQDIFDKYHRLLETWRLHSLGDAPKEEEEQYVADQVALYASARAGFNPQGLLDWWDRYTETHGKTGGWFSDFFHQTKPEQRRLREMLKSINAMPLGCRESVSPTQTADFEKWQSSVVAYSLPGRTGALPGLVSQQQLALPLRPDITYLRFSPDGKYILAQDEAGIHVLTRNPFAVAFYVPAPDAFNASFSPDSGSFSFHNSSLRVETWSVRDQKRTSVHELVALKPCIQSALSPDGLLLACLDETLALSILDVTSGSPLITKNEFGQLTFAEFYVIAALAAAERKNPQFVHMQFSPDGHYFLAGRHSVRFAFDLSTRKPINVSGPLKSIELGAFAFVGGDRLLALDVFSPGKSPLLRFPSGEKLDQVQLAVGLDLSSAAHGEYVIAGPLQDNHPLGILDLVKKNVPAAVTQPAIDVYDDVIVRERLSGELSLDSIAAKQRIASVQLPQARLGTLKAAALSADFTWLALSNSTRGAIWDLPHNVRSMYVRSFQGAYFSNDNSFYVDFPKFRDNERQIGRLSVLDRSGDIARKLGEDIHAEQQGPYLFVTKPRKKDEWRTLANADIEVQNVRDGNRIWSRYFPHELPDLSVGSDTVLLQWPLSSSAGRDEADRFSDLRGTYTKDDYFCELVDFHSDASVGKAIIHTSKGSFHVRRITRDGNWIVVSADNHQVLLYNLATGEQKAHFFGTRPNISETAGLLALESQSAELTLYDLASTQVRRKFVFPNAVSLKAFSPDGKRLFVLTDDQTAYTFDLTADR